MGDVADHGHTIVAYYCVYSDDAVRSLTRCGYRAARLEDGYPDGARVGLPVEQASASG